VALAVKEDVPPDPGDVGLLRAEAVMAEAKGSANAIEQARLGRLGFVGRGQGAAATAAG